MRIAVVSLTALLLVGAPVGSHAQTWALVRGGAYTLPAATVGHIESTLERTVTAAATAQGQKLPPWGEFTLQYQPRLINGHRAVEIRGACHVSPGTDVHQRFYKIADGGPCFFMVVYRLDSRRYSNVVFNGYA